MVRTHVRKTQKGAGIKYTPEDLKQALQDIQSGKKTARGASVYYNIPRSTIRHYVLGDRGKGHCCGSGDGKGGGGVTSYLPQVLELEIAECIKIMEKNGFGLSRGEVIDLVELYIKQNNLTTRFKNGRPGADWFTSFRRRHGLTIKKPQSVEHVRHDQVNPWVIYDYFDKLAELIEKKLDLKGKPGRIYNCDETSFSHEPSKRTIVGKMGANCIRQTTSSGRENTTVLVCEAADGRMIPMLCVFKGKYVMEGWLNNDMSSQTAVSATERGWMESTLFFNWFRNVFLPNIGPERPVMLIYDGHATHVSTKLIKLAQENQVTIMKLPPHTTHLLQPLDVAVFRGLKSQWDRKLCEWQRSNPRKKIPKGTFVSLLTEVVMAVPSDNLISGFKCTGIYDEDFQGPNRNAIPVSVFKPRDFLRYRDGQPKQCSVPSSSGAVQENRNNGLDPSADTPTSCSQTDQAASDTRDTSVEIHQQNSQDEEEPAVPLNVDANLPHSTTSETLTLKEPPQNELGQADQQGPHQETSAARLNLFDNQGKRKSFEDILLDVIHKKESTSAAPTKRRRLVHNCEIITTEQYLKKKEEDEAQKALKSKGKPKKEKLPPVIKNKEKPKPQPQEDETSDDASIPYAETDDDLNMSFSESENEDTNVDVGKYCIVKVYGKTATSFRLYAAEVTLKERGGYMMKFLKRHNQTMKFTTTEEEEFYVVEKDIIRMQSEPTKHTSGRYENMLSFSTDLSDLTNIC